MQHIVEDTHTHMNFFFLIMKVVSFRDELKWTVTQLELISILCRAVRGIFLNYKTDNIDSLFRSSSRSSLT